MNLEFPSFLEFGLNATAEILTRAFDDYFVRIPFTRLMLLNLVRADSVDLTLSRVFVRDGTAVGAAWIARRGWTCRLAGMGVVPEARRTGVGSAAVVQLLDEAQARGDRTMVLEVIEQNTAAVKLYRIHGFETIRRLIGFAGPPRVTSAAGDLVEVDLREVAEAVVRNDQPDLPWQLSGETIAQLTPPAVAYRLDDTWLAMTDPAQPAVVVRALIAHRDVQGRGRELALLRSVMAKYPGRTEWRFQPVWPEELSDAISPLGLARLPLAQWQMKRVV